MTQLCREILNKFRFAITGMISGMMDASIRTQWILALLAVIAGVILKLSAVEWMIVIVCIGCVISVEMLNTCIEKICDMLTTECDERIRYIKDLAAGAVFVVSLAALVCAMIIFIRHII